MTTTTTTATTSTTAWTAAPVFPDISAENLKYTAYKLTNTFASEFGWQLTGNTSDEFNTWIQTNWATQAKADATFDLRGSAYDVDGYMLVGTAKLTQDPIKLTYLDGSGATVVRSRGYIYMCAKDGSDTTGFSCGYIKGDAAEMKAKTYVGTVTSSTLTLAEFNAPKTVGSTVPKQLDINTASATSVFKDKTCKLSDGAGGCWGHKFTYAANASVYNVYYYMLRQEKKDTAVDTDYGFRYNAGDNVDMGIILS
jgi:hypothetical protein